MRTFLLAAIAAVFVMASAGAKAQSCGATDAACQRAALATLAAELTTVADSFRDRGNTGAERRWRSAALAVAGNDGGLSLADAKRWLADSNRNGWGTGKRLLPKVIAAIESLPALVALEAQQQAQNDPPPDPSDIDVDDGQQQFETANQQAVAFDGTIPMHSYQYNDYRNSTTNTLTMTADGTLVQKIRGQGTRFIGVPPYTLPGVCLEPGKGCTEPETQSPSGPLDTFVQDPQEARLERREVYYDLDLDQDGVTDIVKDAKCSGAPKVCVEIERPASCGNGKNISECSISVSYHPISADGVLDGWTITRGESGQAFTRSPGGQVMVFHDGTKIACNYGGATSCNAALYEYNAQAGTHYGNPYHRGSTRQRVMVRNTWTGTDVEIWKQVWEEDEQYKQTGIEHKAPTITPGTVQRWRLAVRKNGENDYTAFGHWMITGHFARSGDGLAVWSNNSRGLAFAGGTNPATDVSGVAGTATYSGESSGNIQWRGTGGTGSRRSTYDGAPVTITADFDRMRMDTTIDLAGRVHEPPGCVAAAGCLQRWRDVGPERIRFYDSQINADGTFGGFHAVHADPEFGHTIEDPNQDHLDFSTHFQGSSLDGRFYVPDGSNAPGQALGTFQVEANVGSNHADHYEVYGAFGAVKQ